MSRSWDEIASTMWTRKLDDSYLIKQMIETRDRYNGDVVVPLLDVEGEPTMGSLAPQIVADGIDHNAMRAAGVIPAISCPAMSGKPRAKETAAVRRRALYANWNHCAIELLLYRFYRHFIGYGTASLVVVPDFEYERAKIELRDPLTSYPELRAPEDFRSPLNVGFVYGRSNDWLARNYPNHMRELQAVGSDTLWDIVEWIDEDDIVLGVLGPRNVSQRSLQDTRYYPSPSGNSVELRRWPNRCDMVPAAVPRRATLDRVMGQLAHVYPTVDFLDRMMALEAIAAERGTFPDMVIMGRRTAAPSVEGGRWKDGREGEPNFVLDADGVQLLNPSVSQSTLNTISMLERSARTSGGVLPQFGGETGGSLRTGRALDALGGFSVDPRIMEAQKFGARALQTINSCVMSMEKGYWPSRKYTVFSGWAGDTELVEYTPEKVFTSYDNSVDYALPGTDVSPTTVALGHMMGAELISKHTARTKHPYIDDPSSENKRIVEERIEDAVLVTFLQQASTGTLPLIDLVRINELYQDTGSMIEAVKTADEEARERQAQQAPPEAPQVQPGLAMPGMGAESAPQGAPPTGPQNLEALLGALQGPPQSTQTIIK